MNHKIPKCTDQLLRSYQLNKQQRKEQRHRFQKPGRQNLKAIIILPNLLISNLPPLLMINQYIFQQIRKILTDFKLNAICQIPLLLREEIVNGRELSVVRLLAFIIHALTSQ